MRARPTLRELARTERPVVAVAAHDALSARMIKRAGFKAVSIGGSSMLASRYGMPDIGLAALEEMVAGARDILAATDLPLLIDGDDGYGDIKSVAHTIHCYERIGVAGIVLEDQARETKQPGDDKPQGVVSPGLMSAKLRAAVAARTDPEMLIIARTDSYALEGLDGAMRRGERYLAAGADGLFVPGVREVEELAKVAAAFPGAYHLVGLFETGKTPWVAPSELGAIGYSQVVFPAAVMLRVVRTIETTLAALKDFADGKGTPALYPDHAAARSAMQDALGQAAWQAFEQKFAYTEE